MLSDVIQELCEKYDVSVVPTFLAFKGENKVRSVTGCVTQYPSACMLHRVLHNKMEHVHALHRWSNWTAMGTINLSLCSEG